MIENMKFSLVYASTIGIETAIMGKVFIVAGNAHYRYKSFSLFHESKRDYFKEIEKQLKRKNKYVLAKKCFEICFAKKLMAVFELKPFC